MFEHKTIRWIVAILGVALIIYIITLLFDESGRSVFQVDHRQEYVTTSIDSTIQVYQVKSLSSSSSDTLGVVQMANVVEVMDSDSVKRYDLYRRQQEKVTIDLEEHKEHIFFTWDDIAAYFHAVGTFFTDLINLFKK